MKKKIKVIALPFAAAVLMLLIMKLYLLGIDKIKFVCLIHVFTGYYCPGCGGTRAVRALLSGHIFRSFLDNPSVILAIIYFILLYIELVFKTFFKPKKIIPENKLFYIVLSGIMVLFYLLRNCIPFLYPR